MQQSSSWVRLFEIARKLEVRNMIIEIHTGAFIMVAILAKEKCIISPDWEGVIKGGFEQSFSRVSLFEIARNLSMYWRENLNFEMYIVQRSGHTNNFFMAGPLNGSDNIPNKKAR